MIFEIMGRNCGYLALAAGIASEADWIFIPENPPDENWLVPSVYRLFLLNYNYIGLLLSI